MMKIMLLAGIMLVCNIAVANTIIVTPKPNATVIITPQPSPTVVLPPKDPNAGDVTAYTLPDDGLTSAADNAEIGRAYQAEIELQHRLNPPLPPRPVPDQNSF